MSSHHTVVSTTECSISFIYSGARWDGGQRTGRSKLRIHALAHNSLQPHTSAHKRNRNIRQRIRPRRVPTIRRDAPLPALPYRNGSSHGEKRLDERAADEPQSGARADAVADSAEEGAEEEGEERG